jgi:hypothetical protein
MLKDFRKKIAYFLYPQIKKDEREIEDNINQRVAMVLSKMNILDYLLKDFHGTFSTEYERPEDKLTERGQLSLKMFGYQQSKDPNFEYLSAWIADHFANDMLRHAAVTPERILYGRAQISFVELWKREIQRLSNLYEDELNKNKIQIFDKTKSVE